jgi:putative PEP-CTERM system TPR-repeat lipoprotein
MQVSGYFKKFVFCFFLLFAICGCESKNRDQFYAEGLEQMERGNIGGAIVLFRNALEKDLNFVDARYQLATAYTAAGKYEQAEKEFQKLFRQNPSHPGTRLGLAKVYILTNRPDMAIEQARKYLQTKPTDSTALEILGLGFAAKNRPVEAESYLMEALKSEPGKTSAKLELSRIYASTGEERKSRALLEEVFRREPKNAEAYYVLAALEIKLGHKDKALRAYEEISEINPDDSRALYNSGLLSLEIGDLAKARKIADAMLNKFAKLSWGHTLKGIVYYNQENYPEAMIELLNSIKIQPSTEAYYFLGLSHYCLGEYESALSQFRKILDYDPNSVRARIIAGMILLKQKRTDDAIDELNKAVQLDGNNALAHKLLGSAYMTKGMFNEGMKELNRSTEIDPELIDAYLKKGVFHLIEGKRDEAETDFKTAVQVAPDMLNTRLVLSSYYMQQENSAKALATLKDGLRGQQSDAALYNKMAGIMFVEKKPTEALSYLQKAKITDPAFLSSYFNQAAYYVTSGDREKALDEYREILRKDPGNLEATFSMASLLDAMGRDREAYDCYAKAVATKKAATYLALAGYHMKNKDPGKALAVLDDAIKKDPKNPAALEMKGRICLGEKKYGDAIKAFDALEALSPGRGLPLKVNTYVLSGDIPSAVEQAHRIITLKPDSAYGYMVLASVYESRNDLSRAIEEVKTGIRASGDSIGALMMLGNLYDKKKDPTAAMGVFQDVLKKNPKYAPAYVAQGVLLEKMGKKKEAAVKYHNALARSENYVPALNNLAYLYAEGYGNSRDALRMAEAAYEREPGNPRVMDTLGYALIKNGRMDEAKRVLEKSAALLPKDPTILYHLALSCSRVGDRKQAAAQLRKAMQLGEFPERGQAGILLAELSNASSGGRIR